MPPTKKRAKDRKATVCRVCLFDKSDNFVQFEVHSEWSRLIEFCFGLPITEADNGPRALCEKCSYKLQEYYEFKKLALKSDTLWNNIVTTEIQKNKTDVKEKVEIKDEVDEFFQDYKDEDCSGSFQDVEYLDVEYSIEDSKNKEKEQYLKIGVDIHPVKDEVGAENKFEHKPKKNKKQTKEKYAKKQLKGLSQKEFIKKYFDVLPTKRANGKDKYECQKCGDELALLKSLPSHVQKCYESEVLVLKGQQQKPTEKALCITPSIFDCGLCAFQNADEDVVMKHFNKHHCLPSDLHCKLCDYTGRDMADVIAHRFKHMPQDCKYRGKYRCPTCGKTRGNELCLQFHYRSFHLKKAGGWCHFCNKTFTGYIYFRNHMRLHMEAKYICDTCGAKFLFRNLIVAHIKEHMNVRNYICDTCGKSFKRNNALSGHIRAYHTDLKPVSCDHCNKQFKNAYSLKLHMKMVNKGNNFICDVCCKGYPNMSLLKKHMFWHTGERPFACETCGGKYKSKGNLKLHMRKHVGIFPYKCDSCEKQFSTSTQLKAHSSVHTGIRRVKCLVCEKTFHEKRQMLAHCQSKHESFMVKQESQGASLASTQVTLVQQGTAHI